MMDNNVSQNGQQGRPISAQKKYCPFIRKSLRCCYCHKLSSQDTEAAIYYCAANYEKCQFYLEHKKQL